MLKLGGPLFFIILILYVKSRDWIAGLVFGTSHRVH